MPSPVTSLFWITAVAAVAPLIAGLVPRKLVPEVVLLIGLGMLIGPYGLEFAETDEAIEMLHELGLAMLFLLAGFEIEPAELTGRAGRRALGTWLVSLALAFGLVGLLGVTDVLDSQVAVAIALTSTALGTLLPILKDNGLLKTRVGASVLRHGAYGELGPILAIALLLGTRGPVESLFVLAAFGVITLLLGFPPLRLRRETSRILELIRSGAETTGQTPVRLTMFLLVTLTAVAAVLELDVVLAAFAAGFILRLAVPDGNEHLEARVEGIAYGLLVPIFFVTSGMAVDPAAIAHHPLAFVAVILLILLVRSLPVFLLSRLSRSEDGRVMDVRDSLAVGLFASTGLPIIVAVTSITVAANEMSPDNASLLVGAGAATVLICPLLAMLLIRSPEDARTDRGRS